MGIVLTQTNTLNMIFFLDFVHRTYNTSATPVVIAVAFPNIQVRNFMRTIFIPSLPLRYRLTKVALGYFGFGIFWLIVLMRYM